MHRNNKENYRKVGGGRSHAIHDNKVSITTPKQTKWVKRQVTRWTRRHFNHQIRESLKNFFGTFRD